MVVLDGVAAGGQVVERVPVGRQHPGDALELGHLVEVGQVVGERVAADEPADVGGDGRQHVVAGEEHAVLGAPHAEVVVGVARGEHGHPVAVAEADGLGVVDHDRGSRRLHPRRLLDAAVGDGAPHAVAEGLEAREVALHLLFVGVGHGVEQRAALGGVGRVEGLEGRLVEVEQVGPTAEHRGGQDLGVRLLDEAVGTTEVIRVRVGDVGRVHPGERDAGGDEALLEGRPRLVGREAGVDEGEAPGVLDGVGVDVPEPGEVGGELEAQDARGDLGDLLRRRLLLLLARPRGRCPVVVAVAVVIPHPGDSNVRRRGPRPTCPRAARRRRRGSTGAP